ncbi:MAG: 50S ribosomal protein L21 [Anaerolineales bacterium]|nr:50S ribosomal protein L21 [Anaerolineales bacterium]
MKYAIVQSGGNQHRCEEGATVQVQRLAVEPGSTYAFEQVLLVSDGDAVKVGAPHVAGAAVKATVVGETKGEKTFSYRYKPKERQRSKRGHRQIYTVLKINEIAG